MRILPALAAALACAPALCAQDSLRLQPEVLFAAVDTMYTVDPVGDTLARSVQTLRRGTLDGAEVWELEYRFGWSRGSRGSLADTTFFDPATLLPVEQRRTGGRRRLLVRYEQGRIRLHRGRTAGGAPADSVVLDAPPPVFAGSLVDLVYRALPLRTGYEAHVASFVPEGPQISRYTVRVEGVGIVETPAGPAEAWRVSVGPEGGSADVFWIDRRTRALLRIDHPNGFSTIR
jgi:hypothetical protein